MVSCLSKINQNQLLTSNSLNCETNQFAFSDLVVDLKWSHRQGHSIEEVADNAVTPVECCVLSAGLTEDVSPPVVVDEGFDPVLGGEAPNNVDFLDPSLFFLMICSSCFTIFSSGSALLSQAFVASVSGCDHCPHL